MRRRFRATALAVVLALLAACGTRPPAPVTEQSWRERIAALRDLPGWQASGKLSIRTADSLDSANFTWTQQGSGSEVRLSGPFGTQPTLISHDPPWITIRGNGESRRLRTGASGLVTVADNPIPITALHEWLLGLPASAMPVDATELDAGLLRRLRQRGWEINYPEYRTVEGLPMPRRMEAQRGPLQLKILVQDWRLHAG